MPRKNQARVRPQHGKPGRISKRPRGWHRANGSQNVQRAVKWLGQEGRA